jgi:hypothetical protein
LIVIEVDDATTRLVPALPPKVTDVAPVKFVPVITTVVPPVSGPLDGDIEVIVGVPDAAPMVMVCVVLVSPVEA